MTTPAPRFLDVAGQVSRTDLFELASIADPDDPSAHPQLVHDDPRPLEVRALVARAILGILEKHSVECFAVPGFSSTVFTVAVHVESRTRALQAIVTETAAHDRPARVEQIAPAPATSHQRETTRTPSLVRKLESASVVRIWWPITDPARTIAFGTTYAVEIEFWSPDDWREGVHSFTGLSDEERRRRLTAPRSNRAVKVIDIDSPVLDIPISSFSRLAAIGADGASDAPVAKTRADLVQVLPDEVRFPIDVVYTWVDGSDAQWARKRAAFAPGERHAEAAGTSRFVNRDELRYSLRSLYANAPWVNRVYIVSDGQSPRWLLPGNGVEVVDHRDIFEDASVLPVFNSHAIEANLHRIPGLSEHFLYLNDDMFIGRPVAPNSFFFPNGLSKFFPSASRVPYTARSQHDSPVDAATKNVRGLMDEAFGVSIAQVMEHAPYALQKSVLEAMARRFADAFAVTAAARFRSPTDVNVPSNFAHHYAFQVGRAVPSTLAFSYIGLSVRDLPLRLDRLLARRDVDAFCLNDTFTTESEVEAQLDLVRPFLEAYFPAKSPWER